MFVLPNLIFFFIANTVEFSDIVPLYVVAASQKITYISKCFTPSDCNQTVISPDAGVVVTEGDSVTIRCETHCVLSNNVTLYKDTSPPEVVAEFNVSGEAMVTLNREDNGVRFYCDVPQEPNARSNDTSFNIQCTYINK